MIAFLLIFLALFLPGLAWSSNDFQSRLKVESHHEAEQIHVRIAPREAHSLRWESSLSKAEMEAKCLEVDELVERHRKHWYNLFERSTIEDKIAENPAFSVQWQIPFGAWQSGDKMEHLRSFAQRNPEAKTIAGPRRFLELRAAFLPNDTHLSRYFLGNKVVVHFGDDLLNAFDLSSQEIVSIAIPRWDLACDIFRAQLASEVFARIESDPKDFLRHSPTRERLETLFTPLLRSESFLTVSNLKPGKRKSLLQGRLLADLLKGATSDRDIILSQLLALRASLWEGDAFPKIQDIAQHFTTRWQEKDIGNHQFEWILNSERQK